MADAAAEMEAAAVKAAATATDADARFDISAYPIIILYWLTACIPAHACQPIHALHTF